MHLRLAPLALLGFLSICSPVQAEYEIKGFGPGKVTVTQTADDGPLVVGTTGGGMNVADGSGVLFLLGDPPKSLTIQMAAVASNLEIDLDVPLPGNLDLRLEDTVEVFFTGDSNTVGGSVKITAGEGDQLVDIAVNAPFSVGKNLQIDLGPGDDTVDEAGNDVTVGGNARFTNVNAFENNGVATFMKNLVWDTKKDPLGSELDNDGTMDILGGLKFTGGDGGDRALLNGDLSIGKNVSISFGDTDGGLQDLLANDPSVEIGGKVSVRGQAPTRFLGNSGASFGGDISVKVGAGEVGSSNISNLIGSFGGKSIKYSSVNGIDDVTVGMTGNPVKISMKLGDEDDTLTLDAGADIGSLSVDFGDGTDTFTNPFGADPDFKLKTKNLP